MTLVHSFVKNTTDSCIKSKRVLYDQIKMDTLEVHWKLKVTPDDSLRPLAERK